MFKQRELSKEFRKNVFLGELGDRTAQENAIRLGKLISKNECSPNAQPIIVIESVCKGD